MGKWIFIFMLCFLMAACNRSNTDKVFFYIGTFTGNGAEGIYLSQFDTKTGVATPPKFVAKLVNPSFQTVSCCGDYLFSVGEQGAEGYLSSFSIDNETGMLSPVENHPSLGRGPCYVAFPGNGYLFAANYRTGTVGKFAVSEGIFNHDDASIYQHFGTGPNAQRQEMPHAHCIVFDIDRKYGYACDLGADKVYVYPADGKLAPIDSLAVTPGAGPRHVAFHPAKKMMAVLNELDATVSVFTTDSKGIFSLPSGVYPLLPDHFNGENKSADIHFSLDGRFLYASNRGHNSIVWFSVSDDGSLERKGWQKEGCVWVRNFAIDPSGKFLLAANRNDHKIVVFLIDPVDGKLIDTGIDVPVHEPVCITFNSKTQKK
jgi:6-phosphogluconolactonase